MCNVRNRCYNDNISCMILRTHCIALESITCHCMATTLGQTLTDRHSIQTKQCPPPITPMFFYRPDALPATQPTVSKHWGQYTDSVKESKRVPGLTNPRMAASIMPDGILGWAPRAPRLANSGTGLVAAPPRAVFFACCETSLSDPKLQHKYTL